MRSLGGSGAEFLQLRTRGENAYSYKLQELPGNERSGTHFNTLVKMSAAAEPVPLKSLPFDFSQSPNLSNLEGRSTLVTGAARGIGLACATKLAEAGAIVTISDVRSELGEAAARDLSAKGLKVQYVQSDVTSYSSQAALFKRAITFGGGKIDIVVPNAGISAEQNLFDMIPAELPNLDSVPSEPGYSTMDVNLRGVLLLLLSCTTLLSAASKCLFRPVDRAYRLTRWVCRLSI